MLHRESKPLVVINNIQGMSMDELQSQIIFYSNLISKNIKNHGFFRYDVADMRYISDQFLNPKSRTFVRKFLRLIENFFPIFIRKVLLIKKKDSPTAYTHIIEAYYINDNLADKFLKATNLDSLIEMLINRFCVDGDIGVYWKYSPNIHFALRPESDLNVPTMPMHALARIGSVLMRIGRDKNNLRLINLSYNSALYAMKSHTITWNDDKMTISYFYNSDDQTINVISEFGEWISFFPTEKKNQVFQNAINGITNFILEEQNEDGSWYYFSKKHMEKWGDSPSIDCHHTATVIRNLINISVNNEFSLDMQSNIELAILNGINFFIEHFFNLSTGQGIQLIGYTRPAGPVQYAETILTFTNFLRHYKSVNKHIFRKVDSLLPKLIKQMVSLVDSKRGSAPSEKIIRWINVDSIRWGNGPVLHALMDYYFYIYEDKES